MRRIFHNHPRGAYLRKAFPDSVHTIVLIMYGLAYFFMEKEINNMEDYALCGRVILIDVLGKLKDLQRW